MSQDTTNWTVRLYIWPVTGLNGHQNGSLSLTTTAQTSTQCVGIARVRYVAVPIPVCNDAPGANAMNLERSRVQCACSQQLALNATSASTTTAPPALAMVERRPIGPVTGCSQRAQEATVTAQTTVTKAPVLATATY